MAYIYCVFQYNITGISCVYLDVYKHKSGPDGHLEPLIWVESCHHCVWGPAGLNRNSEKSLNSETERLLNLASRQENEEQN
jgi:hypothetical protein